MSSPGTSPAAAIRVGNQPYSVLLTSDLSRWKYPEQNDLVGVILRDELTPYLRDLHALLLKLEARCASMLSDVAWVGKPGADSSDMLMKMLGLHPTSIELCQRIGFPDSYLKALQSFLKPGSSKANELASLGVAPASARVELRSLGIDRDFGTIAKMLSMHVLWQHYVTGLDVPNFVEGKPPSETATLAFNYIEWLANAENADQIIREQFPSAKPSALLYLMLRNRCFSSFITARMNGWKSAVCSSQR